ncbi:Oidioi.mRNA.OKI2018_I69.chr2.g6488.t1.cds [Oikopleura dioica]|uniref:Oidioi.mRNA.OKI2018_I69.chr2.g6488.t1.cds n=1 Tax=Oikopleura dioica TaxID=34765 RepID=A0ABN7TCH6_OIKDI|nr:Oidioi.mRNA.OKI2018_I69.chr2.g6488.t1.cds [Oikopleura dioica]
MPELRRPRVIYVTDKELVVSKRELTTKDGYYPTQYHSIRKDYLRRVRFDSYSRVTIPKAKHTCKAKSMAYGLTILLKSKIYARTELPITPEDAAKELLTCPILRRIGFDLKMIKIACENRTKMIKRGPKKPKKEPAIMDSEEEQLKIADKPSSSSPILRSQTRSGKEFVGAKVCKLEKEDEEEGEIRTKELDELFERLERKNESVKTERSEVKVPELEVDLLPLEPVPSLDQVPCLEPLPLFGPEPPLEPSPLVGPEPPLKRLPLVGPELPLEPLPAMEELEVQVKQEKESPRDFFLREFRLEIEALFQKSLIDHEDFATAFIDRRKTILPEWISSDRCGTIIDALKDMQKILNNEDMEEECSEKENLISLETTMNTLMALLTE